MFGLTRQAYYKHNSNQEARSFEESIILDLVRDIKKDHPFMGVRKIYNKIEPNLLEHCIKIGRDGLYTLLWQNGMLVRKRRRKTITTTSDSNAKVYNNLLFNFDITRPNQVFVSDITYIAIPNGFLYLSLVTDAYSKMIMGYSLSKTLHAKSTISALEMALKNASNQIPEIHHSDRGTQYISKDYTDILNSKDIKISMSRPGTPTDNAIAERVNGIIKNEYLKSQKLTNYETSLEIVAKAIKIYNTGRPHMSCNMLTPEQAHKGQVELTQMWKRVRKTKHLKSTT